MRNRRSALGRNNWTLLHRLLSNPIMILLFGATTYEPGRSWNGLLVLILVLAIRELGGDLLVSLGLVGRQKIAATGDAIEVTDWRGRRTVMEWTKITRLQPAPLSIEINGEKRSGGIVCLSVAWDDLERSSCMDAVLRALGMRFPVDRILAPRRPAAGRHVATPLADVLGLLGCVVAFYLSAQPSVNVWLRSWAGEGPGAHWLDKHPLAIVLIVAAVFFATMGWPLVWSIRKLLRDSRTWQQSGLREVLAKEGWIFPNDSLDLADLGKPGIPPNGGATARPAH